MGGPREEARSASLQDAASYHVFKYVARVVNDHEQVSSQHQVTRRALTNNYNRPLLHNVHAEKEFCLNSGHNTIAASWCEINHSNTGLLGSPADSHFMEHSCIIEDALKNDLISPRTSALLISVRAASPCSSAHLSSKGLLSIKLLRQVAYSLSALLSVVLVSLTLLHIGGQDIVDDARLPGAAMVSPTLHSALHRHTDLRERGGFE